MGNSSSNLAPLERNEIKFYIGKKQLFHVTSKEAGIKIINLKRMIPGSQGWFGAGIYFADSREICEHKSKSSKEYLITAMVSMGESLIIDVTLEYSYDFNNINHAFLEKKGCNSIVAKTGHGFEYVVYRSEDVEVLQGIRINDQEGGCTLI